MVVDQRYRGWGVGKMLQQRRMEEMLCRGVQKLTTNADLPETIAWYQKHFGYRKVGMLQKLHDFGDPDIDQWTTLEVNLATWDADRRAQEGS